jgi:transposase
MIEEIFDYMKGSRVYKNHISEEEFTQTWGTVYDIVKYNKKRRNRH